MGWQGSARSQHGVITRAQAAAAGLSEDAVRHRVDSGRWRRVHPGVYLTHSGGLTWWARGWAAVLSYGPGAALASHAAAYVWGLQDSAPAVIPVAVPHARTVVRLPGTRVRRRRHLRTTTVRGLPVTTVAQTVVDLADRPGAEVDDVVALLAGAVQRRRCTPADLRAELASRRGHRLRAVLTDALDDVADGVESVAEWRYVRAVERAHGLPRSAPQSRVDPEGRERRDFETLEFGVVVEVDGLRWHGAVRRRQDRRRDRAASADGRVTLRADWVEVTQQSCDLAVDVALTLRSRGWRGVPRPCSPHCAVRRLGVA